MNRFNKFSHYANYNYSYNPDNLKVQETFAITSVGNKKDNGKLWYYINW